MSIVVIVASIIVSLSVLFHILSEPSCNWIFNPMLRIIRLISPVSFIRIKDFISKMEQLSKLPTMDEVKSRMEKPE